MRSLLKCVSMLALLAATAVHAGDLQTWPANGLPVAGLWENQYFDLTYQVGKAGAHQLLPEIVLPVLPFANTADAVASLAPHAAALKAISDNRWTLIIRHQAQISEVVPKRGEGSAAAWKKLADGTLARTTTYSMVAPPDQWAAEGQEHGASKWMAELQRLCPTPGRIIYADNHEAGVPDFGDKFVKGTPPVGLKWRTKAEIQLMDVRLADWVDANPGGYDADPYAVVPDLYLKTRDLYAAYFTAFRAGLTAWKDIPFQTLAYSCDGPTTGPAGIAQVGPYPEALPFIGYGPTAYPGEGVVSSNLLDPGWPALVSKAVPSWQWSRAKDPDAFRVIWLSFNAPDLIRPVQNGWHEATTPDISVGWCGYMAWLAREPGVPLVLYHWIGNATKPSAKVIVPRTSPQDVDWIQAAKDIGQPELLDLTQEPYALAPMLACDAIATPGVRDFWLKGKTIPVTTTNTKARFVAVQLGDEVRVYGFSPYHSTGVVVVSTGGKTAKLDFAGQPWRYWRCTLPPTSEFVVEPLP